MKSDVEKWLKKDGQDFLKSMGLKEGDVVLDFGCGEGHYALPAANVVGEKGRVYAVEKDEEVLDRLKKLIKNRNLKNIHVSREEKNIFLDNSVDFILCYDVIHYLKKRKPMYHELYRILKPEGIFSLYPKHHKNDSPLMELAQLELEDIIKEVEETGFSLSHKLYKRLIHDDSYNEGYILNFRKD